MADRAGQSVDRAGSGEPPVALPLRARHRRHAERFRTQRPTAHAPGTARLAGGRVYESDMGGGRAGERESGRAGEPDSGRQGDKGKMEQRQSAIRNPQSAIERSAIKRLELEADA